MKDFAGIQHPLRVPDTCYSVGEPIGERNGASRYQDKHRLGEERPVRWVQWKETTFTGKKEAVQTLDFSNFSLPQLRKTSRLASGPMTSHGKDTAVTPLFGPRH
jgi:hypothetical protein